MNIFEKFHLCINFENAMVVQGLLFNTLHHTAVIHVTPFQNKSLCVVEVVQKVFQSVPR